MEAACRNTANDLCFPPLHIPHAVVVLLMALKFHTEDPDGVGDVINIFIFPDISLSVGLEAALMKRKCDAILEGSP